MASLLKKAGAYAAGGFAGGAIASKLFGGGGSRAPEMDPRLRENAGRMATIGNDTYAWNLGEAQRLQPVYRNLSDRTGNFTSGTFDRAEGIGRTFEGKFMPVYDRVASDAMEYDSPAEIERAAGSAIGDTATAFGRAQGRQGAYMARFGLNPQNFGYQRFLMDIEQGKAEAGAANNAREGRRMGGIQLRTGAAGIGGQLLSGANSTGATGILGANATGNLASEGIDVYNRSTQAALPWFTGSNNAFLGQGQADMQRYQTDQAAKAAKWAGIGQIVGTGIGFAAGGPSGAAVGGQLGRGIGGTASPAGSPFAYQYGG